MSNNCDLSWLESIGKHLRHCFSWLPCVQQQNRVYPQFGEPIDCKFIFLDQHKRIRVIHFDSFSEKSVDAQDAKVSDANKLHLKLNDVNGSNNDINHHEKKLRSFSVISNLSEHSSEDYWFTRWSRPTKATDVCNCSFRTSWRLSFRDSKIINTVYPLANIDVISDFQGSEGCLTAKIDKSHSEVIEAYVEILIQKVFCDVIKDLSSICHNKSFSSLNINSSSLSSKSNSPRVNSPENVPNNGLPNEFLPIHSGKGCVNPSFQGLTTDPDSTDSSDYSSLHRINNTSDRSKSEISNNKLKSEYCPSGNSDVSVFQQVCNDKGGNLRDEKFNSDSDICKVSIKLDESCKRQITDCNIFFANQTISETRNNYVANVLPKQDTLVCLSSDNEAIRRTSCEHGRNSKRLKPLLFFLHGVGCSADLWYKLIKHFANEGYEIAAPDMLGHGYSSAPDTATLYEFHHLLKDTIDIFDKFVNDQRKCVVIGHSYGCSFAAALARYRPQNVTQLVLISGGGPTPLAPRTANSRPPSLSPCLTAFMKPLLMCGFRRDILYAPCGKHIDTGNVATNGVPRYVLEHIARGQDWPEGDATFHRRIAVPTLLVHGLQDNHVPLVQECEMERDNQSLNFTWTEAVNRSFEIKDLCWTGNEIGFGQAVVESSQGLKTIPRSFLEVIPTAGHFSMLETPEKLIHMIDCFIDWWSC